MKILMVCLGNICRSPLAQGIAEHRSKTENLDWYVDSAGTSAWHVGELPDRRSIEKAKENGIDITDQRARQIVHSDLEEFDLILAMDTSNYNDILSMARNDSERAKIRLVLDYAYPGMNRAVPDPYYDGGFENVFNLLTDAIQSI